MYVCMYGNKHLHNKSQETLSISCYTSCEGLGLAKTTKNVKNCKCRGKSSGFVFFGWSVCWCRDRSLFCSVLQRNQPKHNWHPCSSWISVEGHTLRPASIPLLKRASKKVVSGSGLPWNGWSKQVIFQGNVVHVKAGWPLFPPIPQALGTVFFFLIPLKVLETLWKMTFTGSLCWCVFCNALWGGHSAWNVSDTYCTQSVCLLKTDKKGGEFKPWCITLVFSACVHVKLAYLCVSWRVVAARHCVWIVFRRRPSCTQRVSLPCAVGHEPGAGKSFERSFHSLLCGRCVFFSPPLLACSM